MKTQELISLLRNSNVNLQLVGNNLKLIGNIKQLSNEVISLVEANKDELIFFLKSNIDKDENIPSVPTSSHYDTTNAQKRIWTLSQFQDGNEAYNISNSFYIIGKLDVSKLEEAFQRGFNKYEILRTVFLVKDHYPVQKIDSNYKFKIEYEEIDSTDGYKNRLFEKIQKFEQSKFNLSSLPLLRIKIFRISEIRAILSFNMHHIIGDGWSLNILLYEVMQSYKFLCLGHYLQLSPLQIQFKDYAAWLNNKISSEFGEKAKKFWESKNLGSVQPINLPIDFPRSPVINFTGYSIKFYIKEDFRSKIIALSHRNKCTTFNIYRAIISILLHKLSGQDSVIIGTPIAGRTSQQLVQQVGLFVNTLPLLSSYEPKETVRNYISRLSSDSFECFKFQDYPLDFIIECSNLKRDLSRNPLFDVMMVMQNISDSVELLDIKDQHDFTLNCIEDLFFECEKDRIVKKSSAKIDLCFNFGVDPGNKEYIQIEYRSDLFKEETILKFYELFINIAEQVFINDENSLENLEIITQEDKDTILNILNRPINKNTKGNVLSLLEESFERRLNEIALVVNGRTFTYDDIENNSNIIASYLSRLNTESKVGVFIGRNEKIIYSIIGLWKAQKIYIPIDTSYPKKRVEYILEDSGIRIVIVDSASLHLIPSNYSGEIVNIDDIKSNSLELSYAIDLESTAYVIYTSGSTGKPKGVEITHQNLISFLRWCTREFEYCCYDIMYASTSYCFDLSIFEFLLPLVQGKKIRILESGINILDFINLDEKIFINTVPSVVRVLIDNNVDWQNVKCLNMAGEAIPEIFKDLLPYNKIEIRNLYGPSEDTTYSTCYRFQDDNLKSIPIGRPIDGTHLYILSKEKHLLPVGMEGEIYLSGMGLAKGYINNPKITNERFDKNPFVSGERIYKTGDIGKWNAKGFVEFLGRQDDQVKIRGYRIEIGEIQHCLEQLDEIEQSIVTIYHENEDKFIIAYYKQKKELTINQIKDHLTKHLPSYMLPSYYILLNEIPFTENGKIDKNKLPQININENNNSAPKTLIESRIHSIWDGILNVSFLGINENFFDLGGHSLKAVKMRNLLNAEFDINLSLNEIFQNPTIYELAKIIENKQPFSLKENLTINKTLETQIPLSLPQKSLWPLIKAENTSKAYHMPVAFEVKGDINFLFLENAFNLIVKKYEILRTVFSEIEGVVYQDVLEPEKVDFKLGKVYLNDANSLMAYLKTSWGMPFDLENGLLIRAELIFLPQSETILSCNIHHIICDGWSVDLLMNELGLFYRKMVNNEFHSEEHTDIQYKDFTIWQNQYFTSEKIEERLEFWRKKIFFPIKKLILPYDKQKIFDNTNSGCIYSHSFSDALSRQIRKLAIKQNTSLFVILLSNVKILLKKLTNQDEILVGVPSSGRNYYQLHQQIGYFVDTLLSPSLISGEMSFEQFLLHENELLISSLEDMSLPFTLLANEFNFRKEMSYSSLFDVMVVMQDNNLISKNVWNFYKNEILLTKREFPYHFAKYDLTFSFKNTDAITLEIEYKTDLFYEESIADICNKLESILSQIVLDEKILIKEISILDDEIKLEYISKFNKTNDFFDQNHSIVSMFNKVAELYPNNIAIKINEKVFTYKELNDITNKISYKLVKEYNVKDEDMICLILNRNEWMIIGMLSVLKAGAAYVPIDPNYPINRKTFIIGDTNTRLVLTESAIDNSSINKIIPGESIIELDQLNLDNVDGVLKKIISPLSLAYVIYTSGTTGNPKGVLIEHKNVYRLLFNESNYFDFASEDKWCLFHSYCFDFSVWEIYGALLYGATLVIVPQLLTQDSELFFEFLHNEKITVLNQTPSAFRSLSLTNSEAFKTINIDVRYLIFGGEALQPFILQEWIDSYPSCKIINMYGITETTVHVSYKEITKMDIGKGISNIGVPIPTLSCYVLDSDLQFCAFGVTGEIFVGGHGLARGYHNNPDLTNEKFIQVGESILYKSGDYGKILPSFEIEYIGRKDAQIKIRGHRIELSEIEKALKVNNSIKDVVVISKKNEIHGNELIAYYISNDNSSEAALRYELSKLLPIYMIPSFFISLKAFPLTPNGKLDKDALPNPSSENIIRNEFEGPSNDIERKITKLWEQVLNIDKIGINDNFFDLGGHSLKATRIISLIHDEFGVKINIETLFFMPTIKELAIQVDSLLWISKEEMGDSDEVIII